MPAISSFLAFTDDAPMASRIPAALFTPIHIQRALGGRETTSSTETETETPTSTVESTGDNPFFTANPTAGTAEGVDGADDNSSGLAKVCLHLFIYLGKAAKVE